VWLLPVFSAFSRICLRIFYRVEVDGPEPPAEGPVLFVANHPNSLLDPASVVAFANRPVRFLAKAPLLERADIGWLVRAAGSIPVHRRQDDPLRVAENDQTFRAAEDALLAGSAIGIFPEGITHDDAHLSVLKTGAARIALGTAVRVGHTFPIIPIGLSFPEKAIFRSRALVVRGRPIWWDDMTGVGPEKEAAVRALTRRIEEGLRSVTVNLERWEDEDIVIGAEAIYAAENEVDAAAMSRLERLRVATEYLARLRATGSPQHLELTEGIRRHITQLNRFGLTPHDLVQGAGRAARATRLDLGVSSLLARGIQLFSWIGGLIFYPPYWATGHFHRLLGADRTAIATHKLLGGIVLFLLWYIALVALSAITWGALAGLVTAIALPGLGIATLWMQDRSAETLGRVRKTWVLQSRRAALESLRQRQIALARRLGELLHTVSQT
jgi:1-acyl-sn-glycerol-3-phosphate acyltransferase